MEEKFNDKNIPDVITKEYFKEHVGREPEQDDLERCNCKDAGKFGHYNCGWCKKCNLPVFMCSCPILPEAIYS